MELLNVILPDSPHKSMLALVERLQLELSQLHKKQYATELTFHEFPSFSQIIVAGKLPSFDLAAAGDVIYDKVSGVLAEYILDQEEMKIIRRILTKEFNVKDTEDIAKIEGYCRQFLFADEETLAVNQEASWCRKEKISRELTAFFQENTTLHMQGFLQFRLQEYMEELREVVEYALDEYQMDQQYQEFISLLKYFVYIQEAKIPIAHLMHRGGNEFVILNDQLKQIDTEEIDASFSLELLDQNTNFEDVIVSTLITVSPQQIYIHTKEPEQQIIKTIMQIFEKRVVLCDCCRLCKTMIGAKKKQESP